MTFLTLTADLVSRIIVFRAYLLHYFGRSSKFGGGCILRWRSVEYHFWVIVTLISDLISLVILSEHISYIV